MSAPQLRDAAQAEIMAHIEARAALLVETTSADLPTLRLWQGEIAGLRIAAGILSDKFRELFG